MYEKLTQISIRKCYVMCNVMSICIKLHVYNFLVHKRFYVTLTS